MRDGQSPPEGVDISRGLMTLLRICKEDLIERAYVELLTAES